MKEKLLLLLFPFSFVSSSKGQSYVVSVYGDTLYGKLHLKASSVVVKASDHLSELDLEQVNFVYSVTKNSTYHLYSIKTGSKKYELAERIEEGRICLYQIEYTISKYGNKAFYLYARKDTGEYKLVATKNVIFIDKDKQRESLLAMLADKEELANRFAGEVANNLDTVTKYIQEYNDVSGVKAE